MAECAICFHEYTSVVPRLLPCGHTFCEICLQALHRNRGIECPSCRVLHRFPADHTYTQLHRNFALEALLRESPLSTGGTSKDTNTLGLGMPALLRGASGPGLDDNKKQGSSQAAAVQCENCSTKSATVVCPGCGAINYCQACYDSVHASLPPVLLRKAGNAHSAIELTRDTMLCSEHPKHKVKHFCEQEQSLICSECVRIGGHSNHTFASITGAANRVRVVLEQKMSAVRSEAARLREVHGNKSKRVTQVEQEAKSLEQQLGADITALKQALSRKEKELAMELQTMTIARVAKLEDEMKQVDALVQSAEETFKKITHLLSPEMDGGDIQLLTVNKSAVDQLIHSLSEELKTAYTAQNDSNKTTNSKDMAPMLWLASGQLSSLRDQVEEWAVVTSAEHEKRLAEQQSKLKAAIPLAPPALGASRSADPEESSDEEYEFGFDLFD